MCAARWPALLAAAFLTTPALSAQEYAGHPERFGAGVPELRGGDDVRVRVRVDSLAVAAVLHLRPDGVVVVAAVRVLEPGQHDLPVTRIVRTGEVVQGTQRVPFVVSSADPMGRPPPRMSLPRAAPTPSGPVPVQAILILADAPLDSAALAARLVEGIAVNPDSLAWQVPPALIREPTTVWAAVLLQRR